MKQFQGFPSGGKVEYSAVPKMFFSSLLPDITDAAELKTTFYVIAALYGKKGYPRFIGFNELLANTPLMTGLKNQGGEPEQVLRTALKMAVERGTLINIRLSGDGKTEDIYFLNSESDRQAAEKVKSGELKLAGLKVVEVPAPVEPLPDIYTLYEQNVGMLTPMIADELRDAEKLYPPEWIKDAIKEASLHNKRSIKYILKILENWSVEGRGDGTYQRDIKKTDPNRFIKGKYGHVVRH